MTEQLRQFGGSIWGSRPATKISEEDMCDDGSYHFYNSESGRCVICGKAKYDDISDTGDNTHTT